MNTWTTGPNFLNSPTGRSHPDPTLSYVLVSLIYSLIKGYWVLWDQPTIQALIELSRPLGLGGHGLGFRV